MAAPNDPKEKPKVTLDLDIKASPESTKKDEAPSLQFRPLNATVIRPGKPKQAAQPRITPVVRPKANKSKARPKGNKSKPIFILAGLLISGYLISNYLGSLQPSPPQPVSAPPARMKAKASVPVATATISNMPSPPETITDPHQSIRAANLNQLGTEIDEKGNTYFAIRVKPKPVCYPADVEAMRNVVGNTGSLLLSLEPMAENGKTKAPISRVISLKEISEGIKVSLPVNLKESGVYGIYICSDAKGSKTCGEKKPADFNKILNFRDLDVAANAVFYYQFAVIGLEYATLYAGLPDGIAATREELQRRKPEKDWTPQLEKAAGLMRGVKSLPPTTTVEGKVVTMELQVAMVNPDGSCR